jgi:hypothetical protein
MSGDGVMADPLRQNIDGEKIVHHRFDHGVDWQVNVSHLLAAIGVALLILYLKPWNGANNQEEGPEDGGVATR